MTITTTTPRELRRKIRACEHTGPTSGLCPGYIQANMVILPSSIADDFHQFCTLNPKPCPLLEKIDAGQFRPKILTCNTDTETDIRTDLPKYRVYKHGVLQEEVTDITHLWREDLVTFFIGCSFSFEKALLDHGIPVRNIEEGKNVSMYQTTLACKPAGAFTDVKMVVSMRPVPEQQIPLATKITAQFQHTHGEPVYSGLDYEKELGIKDLSKVDFGDAVTIHDGEVPMFSACGVTAIVSAISAKTDLCITHSPGHMFVTDMEEPKVDWETVLNE